MIVLKQPVGLGPFHGGCIQGDKGFLVVRVADRVGAISNLGPVPINSKGLLADRDTIHKQFPWRT